MSDAPTDEAVSVNWVAAAAIVGIVEVVFFGFFLTETASALYDSVDGAPYRVREAMLMGGEVSVAAAFTVAILASRQRPSLLAIIAAGRVVASMVSLAYPFADGWFYLLDPARPMLSTKVVFGLAVAHTLASVLAAATTRSERAPPKPDANADPGDPTPP